MTIADNAYSRLVAWLKILFPLAALAILATLFLFSRVIDPTQAIPFAEVDVEALIKDPRIIAPDYAGVTEDGAALTIRAVSARPDADAKGSASASGPVLVIETPDGVRTEISADTGQIDNAAGTVQLLGSVSLSTTLGYRIETGGISASLDRTRLETEAGITATGPLGTLTAGKMLLQLAEPVTHTYVLVFTGGVKLLYDPKK